MGKKNPYDSKKTFAISEQERQARNKEIGAVDTTAGEGKGIARLTSASVNPAFERFYSPTGMSTWKKGQIDTRTTATNKAFNDAVASNRLRGRMAGFGYEQPVEQAGETNIENARAGELARIRGDVEAEAVPIEMEGIRGRLASGAQEAGSYGDFGRLQLGSAGEYSPENYYQTGAQQAEQEAARRGGLFGGLAKMGLGIAGSFIPGAGAFGSLLGGKKKPISTGYSV